jgi:NAD(P)-dependent dehydrogenase (short-subunit alcohol dehydrogenase family)
MGLVDRKAGLVTGSAGGLGRACALRLAEEGASVVVTDLESMREGGEETVRMIEAAGGTAVFVPGDVTVEADQQRLVAETVSAFGRLDFAHNNAGVDAQGSIEETSYEVLRRTLEVNLMGVFLGMKFQMPQMRTQGGGSIVNTGSGAGIRAPRNLAAYTASKFGVVGISQAAALEGGDDNIRVNCLCPSAMRTPMLDELPQELRDRLTSPQAIHRLSEPREVAENVVWLVSDRSSLITGATFTADLGITAGLIY